uniref:polysaccharide biosynthesis/export family protein n=1 Tax=Methylobacterium sp. B34 TaxID=95563 RepID=UPI0016511E32|nr:polysaccharide biosynthesis/export family protein [Methylobacterium sp. B34]
MKFPAILASIIMLSGALQCVASEYKLGAEDKIRVNVVEWRPSKGDTYTWAPLNEEFTVGPDGILSLPLVGDLNVMSLTTEQVGRKISELLQKQLGLVAKPTASIEVTKYRPFYITGDVAHPGEFSYKPDLTVMKAIALAGGTYRYSEGAAAGFLKDAIVARGEVSILQKEKISLVSKKARLEAESKDLGIAKASSDAIPITSEADLRKAIVDEQAILSLNQSVVRSKIDSLNQEKKMLTQEIGALNAKDASLDKQLALASGERDNVKALADKGLVISSRQLATEQTVAQMESSRIDISVAKSRAEQARIKLDRDIIALQEQRRAENLLELRQVDSRIKEVEEKIRTSQSLLAQATEINLPAVIDSSRGDLNRMTYSITRKGPNGLSTFSVTPISEVEAGDVVQVRRPRSDTDLSDELLNSNQINKNASATDRSTAK